MLNVNYTILEVNVPESWGLIDIPSKRLYKKKYYNTKALDTWKPRAINPAAFILHFNKISKWDLKKVSLKSHFTVEYKH